MILAPFWWKTKHPILFLLAREVAFFCKKCKVQYRDELNHKIALKFSKK